VHQVGFIYMTNYILLFSVSYQGSSRMAGG